MGFIKDLFSSPSDKLPSNREMLDYMRSDRIGANPNVNSRYGSTDVQWDGDQATITQTLSPGYDQLADMQLAYLQGGPQQLGNYSNPSIENMFSQFANRVGNRGGGFGFDVGGLSQQQGQNGLPQQAPYMGPQQPTTGSQMPSGPQVPMSQEQHNIPPAAMGGGMGGGNGGDFSRLFADYFMNQQSMRPPIDFRTGR